MERRDFLFAMAGAVATALPLATASEASAPWVLLGSRRVGLIADHDAIFVGPMPPLRKLRLAVTGNGLFIYDMHVTYGNGAPDHIPVRWHIPQGGATRVIDLRGGTRLVRRVDFIYGKLPNGRGRTNIHLFGQV